MIDFNKIPFMQAKWYTEIKEDKPRHIQLIVLHSMEAPEKGTTAEDTARYFSSLDRKASAHYCVDDDSIVQCVQTKDVAYAAPNANANGVHIEMAGYAKQTREQWMDVYSLAILWNVAGLCAKVLMPKFDIPLTFLRSNSLELCRIHPDLKGFTTHAEVSKAFNPGGHWDPGPGFPIDVLFDKIKARLKEKV